MTDQEIIKAAWLVLLVLCVPIMALMLGMFWVTGPYTRKRPSRNRTVRKKQHVYARSRTTESTACAGNSQEQDCAGLPKLTLNQEVAGSSPARGTSGSSTSGDSPSGPKTP